MTLHPRRGRKARPAVVRAVLRYMFERPPGYQKFVAIEAGVPQQTLSQFMRGIRRKLEAMQ